ncbi:hypothetical protein SBADM41S_03334 [Streptomyces badius]
MNLRRSRFWLQRIRSIEESIIFATSQLTVLFRPGDRYRSPFVHPAHIQVAEPGEQQRLRVSAPPGPTSGGPGGRPRGSTPCAATTRQTATSTTFLTTYCPSIVGAGEWGCHIASGRRKRVENTPPMWRKNATSAGRSSRAAGDQADADGRLESCEGEQQHGLRDEAQGHLRGCVHGQLRRRGWPRGNSFSTPKPDEDEADRRPQQSEGVGYRPARRAVEGTEGRAVGAFGPTRARLADLQGLRRRGQARLYGVAAPACADLP